MTRSPDPVPSATMALLRIARALPLRDRAYAVARFLTLRRKLLAAMDLLLPERGRILDVGCGVGLWAAYFSQMQPERRVTGVDPDGRRIAMARHLASRLGVAAEFLAEDIRYADVQGPFDAIYALDVLHHIGFEVQGHVLARLTELLAPGGILLLLDITTTPWLGLKFTHALDRLVGGRYEPLAYRHHHDWRALLEELGHRVRVVRVPDLLPYPHVVITATRAAVSSG